MDVDRVGIYGCSAGGQESTNAVLLYPIKRLIQLVVVMITVWIRFGGMNFGWAIR